MSMTFLFFQLSVGWLLTYNNHTAAQAPCPEYSFSYRVVSSGSSHSIEITRGGSAPERYTLKLFKVSGSIELMSSKENLSAAKTNFNEVAAADYLVQISWGAGCVQTLGGVEGIKVDSKTANE